MVHKLMGRNQEPKKLDYTVSDRRNSNLVQRRFTDMDARVDESRLIEDEMVYSSNRVQESDRFLKNRLGSSTEEREQIDRTGSNEFNLASQPKRLGTNDLF